MSQRGRQWKDGGGGRAESVASHGSQPAQQYQSVSHRRSGSVPSRFSHASMSNAKHPVGGALSRSHKGSFDKEPHQSQSLGITQYPAIRPEVPTTQLYGQPPTPVLNESQAEMWERLHREQAKRLEDAAWAIKARAQGTIPDSGSSSDTNNAGQQTYSTPRSSRSKQERKQDALDRITESAVAVNLRQKHHQLGHDKEPTTDIVAAPPPEKSPPPVHNSPDEQLLRSAATVQREVENSTAQPEEIADTIMGPNNERHIPTPPLPPHFVKLALNKKDEDDIGKSLPSPSQARRLPAQLTRVMLGKAAINPEQQPTDDVERSDDVAKRLSTLVYATIPAADLDVLDNAVIRAANQSPDRLQPQTCPEAGVINRIMIADGQEWIIEAKDVRLLGGDKVLFPITAYATHQIMMSASIDEPTAQSEQIRLARDPWYRDKLEADLRQAESAVPQGLANPAELTTDDGRRLKMLVDDTCKRAHKAFVIHPCMPSHLTDAEAYKYQLTSIVPLDLEQLLARPARFNDVFDLPNNGAVADKRLMSDRLTSGADADKAGPSRLGQPGDDEETQDLMIAAKGLTPEMKEQLCVQWLSMINYNAEQQSFSVPGFRQKFFELVQQGDMIREESKQIFPQGIEAPKQIMRSQHLIPQVVWQKMSKERDEDNLKLRSASDPRQNYTLSFDQTGSILACHFLSGPSTESTHVYVSSLDELRQALHLLRRKPNLQGLVTDPELTLISWDLEFASHDQPYEEWDIERKKLLNLIPARSNSKGPFAVLLSLANQWGLTVTIDLRWANAGGIHNGATKYAPPPQCLRDFINRRGTLLVCFDLKAETGAWENTYKEALSPQKFVDLKVVASDAVRQMGLEGAYIIEAKHISLAKAFQVVTGDKEAAQFKAGFFAQQSYKNIGVRFLKLPQILISQFADMRYVARDVHDNLTILNRLALADFWTRCTQPGQLLTRHGYLVRWIKEVCALRPEALHERLFETEFTGGECWPEELHKDLKTLARDTVKQLVAIEANRDKDDTVLKFRLPQLTHAGVPGGPNKVISEAEPLTVGEWYKAHGLLLVAGVHDFGKRIIMTALDQLWRQMSQYVSSQNRDYTMAIRAAALFYRNFDQQWNQRSELAVNENLVQRQWQFEVDAVALRQLMPAMLAPYTVCVLGDLIKILANCPLYAQLHPQLVSTVVEVIRRRAEEMRTHGPIKELIEHNGVATSVKATPSSPSPPKRKAEPEADEPTGVPPLSKYLLCDKSGVELQGYRPRASTVGEGTRPQQQREPEREDSLSSHSDEDDVYQNPNQAMARPNREEMEEAAIRREEKMRLKAEREAIKAEDRWLANERIRVKELELADRRERLSKSIRESRSTRRASVGAGQRQRDVAKAQAPALYTPVPPTFSFAAGADRTSDSGERPPKYPLLPGPPSQPETPPAPPNPFDLAVINKAQVSALLAKGISAQAIVDQMLTTQPSVPALATPSSAGWAAWGPRPPVPDVSTPVPLQQPPPILAPPPIVAPPPILAPPPIAAPPPGNVLKSSNEGPSMASGGPQYPYNVPQDVAQPQPLFPPASTHPKPSSNQAEADKESLSYMVGGRDLRYPLKENRMLNPGDIPLRGTYFKEEREFNKGVPVPFHEDEELPSLYRAHWYGFEADYQTQPQSTMAAICEDNKALMRRYREYVMTRKQEVEADNEKAKACFERHLEDIDGRISSINRMAFYITNGQGVRYSERFFVLHVDRTATRPARHILQHSRIPNVTTDEGEGKQVRRCQEGTYEPYQAPVHGDQQ